MKTSFILIASLVLALSTNAQVTKTVKPAPKTVNPLKNLEDSANYAMGLAMATFYKQQGVKKINTILVNKAINDVMTNKTPIFTDDKGNVVMNLYMTRIQEQKAKAVIDSGIAFLARNKKRAEVKTTASGLQYEILREGTGMKPTPIDTVVAHYRGTLTNGTEFESSYSRGEPLVYPANKLITGWTEALQLMSVGAKYKLYIPHNLAYGSFDNGPIPGGSALIFELELLDVRKAK